MRKLTRISTVELWFEQYHERLLLMGVGRWHNLQLVDDAIQDVFLGLLEKERAKPAAFDHVQKPLAYLTTCLNRQVSDNLQKEGRVSGDDVEKQDWPADGASETDYCELKRAELDRLLELFQHKNILHPVVPSILELKSQGCRSREIEAVLQLRDGYANTLFARFKKRVDDFLQH